jgi:hypothetical protein
MRGIIEFIKDLQSLSKELLCSRLSFSSLSIYTKSIWCQTIIEHIQGYVQQNSANGHPKKRVA